MPFPTNPDFSTRPLHPSDWDTIKDFLTYECIIDMSDEKNYFWKFCNRQNIPKETKHLQVSNLTEDDFSIVCIDEKGGKSNHKASTFLRKNQKAWMENLRKSILANSRNNTMKQKTLEALDQDSASNKTGNAPKRALQSWALCQKDEKVIGYICTQTSAPGGSNIELLAMGIDLEHREDQQAMQDLFGSFISNEQKNHPNFRLSYDWQPQRPLDSITRIMNALHFFNTSSRDTETPLYQAVSERLNFFDITTLEHPLSETPVSPPVFRAKYRRPKAGEETSKVLQERLDQTPSPFKDMLSTDLRTAFGYPAVGKHKPASLIVSAIASIFKDLPPRDGYDLRMQGSGIAFFFNDTLLCEMLHKDAQNNIHYSQDGFQQSEENTTKEVLTKERANMQIESIKRDITDAPIFTSDSTEKDIVSRGHVFGFDGFGSLQNSQFFLSIVRSPENEQEPTKQTTENMLVEQGKKLRDSYEQELSDELRSDAWSTANLPEFVLAGDNERNRAILEGFSQDRRAMRIFSPDTESEANLLRFGSIVFQKRILQQDRASEIQRMHAEKEWELGERLKNENPQASRSWDAFNAYDRTTQKAAYGSPSPNEAREVGKARALLDAVRQTDPELPSLHEKTLGRSARSPSPSSRSRS